VEHVATVGFRPLSVVLGDRLEAYATVHALGRLRIGEQLIDGLRGQDGRLQQGEPGRSAHLAIVSVSRSGPRPREEAAQRAPTSRLRLGVGVGVGRGLFGGHRGVDLVRGFKSRRQWTLVYPRARDQGGGAVNGGDPKGRRRKGRGACQRLPKEGSHTSFLCG